MERTKKYDRTKLVRSSDAEGIKDLASHLKGGEVVGFPTETVYGLGADATNADAVKKIFEAKGRPSDNPLICHIASKDQIKDLVAEITPVAQKLIDSFMPGPVTVIMKKSSIIPDEVTAGLDTVGVRMPSNPVANKFLKACGVPVAAPSANLSGRPSPTGARSVLEDMDGYIYAVIDGGDSKFGLESTVVDCTGTTPVILRPGAVTKADIDSVLKEGEAVMSGSLADKETPKAPGMKYRHYAPYAQVEIMKMPEGTKIEGDDAIGSDGKIGKTDFSIEDLKKLSDDEAKELVNIVSPFILRSREILSSNPFARIGLYCGSEIKAMYDKMNDKLDAADLEVVHTFGAYYAQDYIDNGEHIEWHYINPQPFTFRVSFNSDSSDAVIVLHYDSNIDQWVIVGKADSTTSVDATVSNLSPFAIVKASPATSSQTGEYAGAYIVMVAAALAACGAVFAIRAKKATR